MEIFYVHCFWFVAQLLSHVADDEQSEDPFRLVLAFPDLKICWSFDFWGCRCSTLMSFCLHTSPSSARLIISPVTI